MSRPRYIPWEPVRRPSPKRPGETFQQQLERCRAVVQASIDEQKQRFYNRIPSPCNSEEERDVDSVTGKPFKLQWWHTGLTMDNPNLIYYGIKPQPLVSPEYTRQPIKEMYPPFWWRDCYIADDSPILHEKWKQPFWWQEYDIADDDPRLQEPWKRPFWWREHGISDDDPRLAHNKKKSAAVTEKRPAPTSASNSRDPTAKPSVAAGSKRKRSDCPKDDTETKYGPTSRAVKRPRSHHRGSKESTEAVLKWLSNSSSGPIVSIKRQREPDDHDHRRDRKRARVTASVVRVPLNTTSSDRARISAPKVYSDRPATHHASVNKPSSGKASGAPSNSKTSVKQPTSRKSTGSRLAANIGSAARYPTSKPSLSQIPSNNTSAARQPKSKTPTNTLSTSKKRSRDVDETYVPVETKRRKIANPIQRLNGTLTTPLSPISPPPQTAPAPIGSRRQTRSSKSTVLLEISHNGQPLLQQQPREKRRTINDEERLESDEKDTKPQG